MTEVIGEHQKLAGVLLIDGLNENFLAMVLEFLEAETLVYFLEKKIYAEKKITHIDRQQLTTRMQFLNFYTNFIFYSKLSIFNGTICFERNLPAVDKLQHFSDHIVVQAFNLYGTLKILLDNNNININSFILLPS
jgi:hypothetical protein